MKRKISGILLAGGKSKRMGEDKAFIKYQEKELFRYPLEILEHFCDEIIISSSNPSFNNTGHLVYPDDVPGLGPIGGIHTCLIKTKNEYSIVLGCDTPLLDHLTISELIKNIKNYNIVVAVNSTGHPESLVGIYKKKSLASIDLLIEKKNYKMSDLLKQEKTHYHKLPYSKSKLTQLFSNINTQEDFQRLSANE